MTDFRTRVLAGAGGVELVGNHRASGYAAREIARKDEYSEIEARFDPETVAQASR